MFHRSWRSKMTASEARRGSVFFLLYLLVFPRLNAWIQQLLMGDGETEVLVAEANVIYYLFLFILALFVFWGFLREDFVDLMDWLPENLFGLAAGLAVALAGRTALNLLPLPVSDPIPFQYASEFRASPTPTLVLVLLLIPLVEEVLFRGLLFGQLRGYSRPLAFGVSILGYALALVWRYALDFSEPRYLLLGLLYLPLSAGLTWCYDNGGSIWSCVALHAGFNGFLLFTAL